MGITSFLHVKLNIRDLPRSLSFYCGTLGCKEICRYQIPRGLIVQVSPTGTPPGIELWYEEPLVAGPDEQIHIAFSVDDMAAFVQWLQTQGVWSERGPFRIGDELIAFIRDPDGHLIELNQDLSQGSSPCH